MVWGAVAFFVGALLSMFGFMFHFNFILGLGSLAVLGGAFCFIGSIFLGLSHNKKIVRAPVRAEVEARVMARYAINHLGEMIFDNFEYDAERAKYYVKLLYLNGTTEELQTSEPVFHQAGEGMRGLVVVQGNWLSRFAMLQDNEETRAMYKGL